MLSDILWDTMIPLIYKPMVSMISNDTLILEILINGRLEKIPDGHLDIQH